MKIQVIVIVCGSGLLLAAAVAVVVASRKRQQPAPPPKVPVVTAPVEVRVKGQRAVNRTYDYGSSWELGEKSWGVLDFLKYCHL